MAVYCSRRTESVTYLVGVVLPQNPAAACRHVLVALGAAAHAQGSVHVHVVAGQVQRDQTLEDDAPAREGLRQENQQTRRGAAVGHHVQHGAELGALLIGAGCVAIERVEQTRYAVQGGACARVEGHVVERDEGKEDAGITWV